MKKQRLKKGNKSQTYFVLIPAYNEESRIEEVLSAVRLYTQDIIVIDDGSIDKTGEIARKKGVLVLRHNLNLGKGAAVKTGAEMAWYLKADAVVILDADQQHCPDEIPIFISKLREGFDIVFGSRNLDFNVPFMRLLGNKIASVLIKMIFGIHRSDLLCGFMAFTKKTYGRIKWDSARYGLETEIVARTGKNKLKYTQIPIQTVYLDRYKGVTIIDAFGVLLNIPRWLVS